MIEAIRKEAEALSQKQTWVRKGFSDLLEEMNSEVRDIPHQAFVGDFTIRGKLYAVEDEYSPYEAWFLTFDGRYGAEFNLQTSIEQYEPRYEYQNIETCGIVALRKCVAGIPSALEEILGKLQELSAKYQEAIDKLAEMLTRLS